jgi:hypothetical protein
MMDASFLVSQLNQIEFSGLQLRFQDLLDRVLSFVGPVHRQFDDRKLAGPNFMGKFVCLGESMTHSLLSGPPSFVQRSL